MRSRPTLAMLARYCYPDVSPWTLSLREVERLNVKPTSVVWRVRLLVRGQSRTLFLKHCYGKKSYLQTRLYKDPPPGLQKFQPTIAAIWPDHVVGGHWLAMKPIHKLPPYGNFQGRQAVIERLADMQSLFFFARGGDVKQANLTWLPDFFRRVYDAHRRGAMRKELERHAHLLPKRERWQKRLAMAIKGVPKLISKIEDGPKTLAHGDVHRGNVGLGDDETIRLIDWSRCTIAPLPFDLVYAVERALARFPEYQARHRPLREWAVDTYITRLAKHGHKVSHKHVMRQYEITYVLYSLTSSLWKRLRMLADGDAGARHVVPYQLARIDEWGKKYGVIR